MTDRETAYEAAAKALAETYEMNPLGDPDEAAKAAIDAAVETGQLVWKDKAMKAAALSAVNLDDAAFKKGFEAGKQAKTVEEPPAKIELDDKWVDIIIGGGEPRNRHKLYKAGFEAGVHSAEKQIEEKSHEKQKAPNPKPFGSYTDEKRWIKFHE